MNKWLENVIIARALEMDNEQKNPGWFSITAITKVPYIAYPTLNETECKEIQEQTKEVLRISRNKNHYQEVAITYNIHSQNSDKYKVVLGNIGNIEICNDSDTLQLLQVSDAREELAVISIHNHPNNSMFSINDLLIFAEHPGIKIMAIVNKNGEIAFLLRPKFEKYHSLIELLEAQGVYIHNYVNQEQAKNIDFTPFIANISGSNKDINHDSEKDFTDDYLYLENGEDDYEWEER